MSINLPVGGKTTTFGQRNIQSVANQQDRPKAQIWLNIGYYINEGEETERFISLPTGIPLDTMERVSERSSNTDYAMLQHWRNDLLDQMLELTQDLAPGESHVIRMDGALCIQLRRVADEVSLPTGDQYKPPRLFEKKAA